VKICKHIKFAGDLIQKGEIVAFPSETVYSLGADAFNPNAVSRIFEMKERPAFDPLIVHISNLKQLDLLCKHVDNNLPNLAKKFWLGPLTIVVEKNDLVPDIVTTGLNTVGVRSIDKGFVLLQPGATTLSELEKELPQIASHDFKENTLSPGLLKSHYSPKMPIYLISDLYNLQDLSKAGLISFGVPTDYKKHKHIEILSKNKDLTEAAINLFSAIHNMESTEVDFIIAESIPETGISIAIMDRLKKASYRFQLKEN
jgi:L-threonylcarbamoyladenylate synthase